MEEGGPTQVLRIIVVMLGCQKMPNGNRDKAEVEGVGREREGERHPFLDEAGKIASGASRGRLAGMSSSWAAFYFLQPRQLSGYRRATRLNGES